LVACLFARFTEMRCSLAGSGAASVLWPILQDWIENFRLSVAALAKTITIVTDWAFAGAFARIPRERQEIGRLYEDQSASRPEIAWVWSITIMGRRAPAGFGTDGQALALEEAKAQFAASWEASPAGGRGPGFPRHECRTHRLAGTPRATKPPWIIEAGAPAHDSVEAKALLPFSTVTPPCSIMAVSGPFRVKT
jgi:hypothetical protein